MPIKSSQFNTSYQKVASLYHQAYFLRRLFVWARWRICPFEKLLNSLPPSKTLLEIGCGIGLFSNLAALSKKAESVTGIDQNKDTIAVAKKTLNGQHAIQFFQLKDIDEHPKWMVWMSFMHDMIQAHRPYLLKRGYLKRLIHEAQFEIIDEWSCSTVYVPHITFVAKKVRPQ